jgi:hypothetical protein
LFKSKISIVKIRTIPGRSYPSLSDHAWLTKIRNSAHRRYSPLFYNLSDEARIADLDAFWDFDFSPTSLAAMRESLMSQYGTLDALNAEWGFAVFELG